MADTNKRLELTAVRFEDGIIHPWLTYGPVAADGKPIEMKRAEAANFGLFADMERELQEEFELIQAAQEEDFQNLLRETKRILEPRRMSIPDIQLMRPVPVTPHTNKTKKVRSRRKKSSSIAEIDAPSVSGVTLDFSDDAENIDPGKTKTTKTKPPRAKPRKKSSIAKSSAPKRVTRSSKASSKPIVLMEDIQEIKSEYITPPPKKEKPRKPNRTVTIDLPSMEPEITNESGMNTTPVNKTVPMDSSPKEADIPKENNLDTTPNKTVTMDSSPKESEIVAESNMDTTPKATTSQSDMNSDAPVDMSPDMMDSLASSEEENVNSVSPPDVRQLISVHENFIINQSEKATQSQKKKESEDVYSELHASPECTAEQVKVKPQRSMEDMVQSCMKKLPIVNVSRLKVPNDASTEVTESPQQGPITLTFDASDEEEDIADSITEIDTAQDDDEDEKCSEGTKLPRTPVGAWNNGILPPRRSLDPQLRLSLAKSELGECDTDIINSESQDDDADPKPLDQENDSLEEGNQEDNREASKNTSATISQASTSVCSSSAATVVLENILRLSEESQTSSSGPEEAMEQSPPVRRSTRIQNSIPVPSIPCPEIEGAIVVSDASSSPIRPDTTGESAEESTGEAVRKKPKIVKPVRKPPKAGAQSKKLPTSASSTRPMPRLSSKRNLDDGEREEPKTKHMRCASPLCKEKPKRTRASKQKSRNTFLNRSTAASRARRTPGQMSPATASRSKAALLAGSPFKLQTSHQSLCLTPMRSNNLATGVSSFIKRMTPQKVNYQEQLAAKKKDLEEKERREREIKRQQEEEKQKEIEEKKRERYEKRRKAAETREKKYKEIEETRQKQVEQWEKRVAGANKVKVLRKKEETAKVKKLERKQAEAEEIRKKEEEERIRKLKEQEQEKEHRLHEQKLLREQEVAARKQAEHEKQLEKQRQEKLREEAEAEETRKRLEEEKMKRDEEEKVRRKKAEEAHKTRQQKLEKEEAERKRKMQEEIDKRNAEAARIEQERIEKEKEAQKKMREEAQRRQEEAIRKKEREEARKRKLEESKAAAAEKARKRRQEEMAKAEEARRKREEIRKEAERRREEERKQREEEKKQQEEEKRKQREEAEKLRKIQESNERLRQLEEEHKKEREVLKSMGLSTTMDKSLHRTPGPNSTFIADQSSSRLSPQSYDITPQVVKPILSTEENYNIDDLSSGDSTDDDERPRKVIPKWAKGSKFRNQLVKQYYNPPNKEIVFRDALDRRGIRLDDIFDSCKRRYFTRTSSAHWNSPIMPVGHLSFTDQCRGFDYSMSEKM